MQTHSRYMSVYQLPPPICLVMPVRRVSAPPVKNKRSPRCLFGYTQPNGLQTHKMHSCTLNIHHQTVVLEQKTNTKEQEVNTTSPHTQEVTSQENGKSDNLKEKDCNAASNQDNNCSNVDSDRDKGKCHSSTSTSDIPEQGQGTSDNPEKGARDPEVNKAIDQSEKENKSSTVVAADDNLDVKPASNVRKMSSKGTYFSLFYH